MTTSFPTDFTWGAATAAYQIEGAVAEDGRTPSIWDTFSAKPGTIADGATGEIATDSYHRYREDIDLMKRLGLQAYRFSISWSRIQPEPGGQVNQKGLDHYKRQIDALRDAGILPVVTMYHWDLPQYLQDRGGWPARDTAYRYADYVEILAEAFGDSVDMWGTLNEPWCVAFLGYGNGVHAPGVRDHAKALASVHHLNLAHGLGLQALHGVLGDTARTSVTLNLTVARRGGTSLADNDAYDKIRRIANDSFLLPMLEGRYDPQLFEDTKEVTDWSFVHDGDLDNIHQPFDVLGLNYYATTFVKGRHPDSVTPDDMADQAMPAMESVEELPAEGEVTTMGWNQEPQGLTDMLVEIGSRYPDVELAVTENGSAWHDDVTSDSSAPGGKIIHDPNRVAYLREHVEAVAEAIDAGANVTSYFVWSLIDNFEWAYGYSQRFGLVGVDYETQERIWKDSASEYRHIIANNGL